MTEEQLKSKNPWKEVADMYNPNKENCLYDEDNYYVCSCDKDAIKKYNEKALKTRLSQGYQLNHGGEILSKLD